MSKDKKTKSRFMKIKCGDCGNEQVVFGCVASKIKCIVCEKSLAESTGGKTKFLSEIVEVLDKDI
ncbi:MAG: 30S ribosomal protein S27e [Candidatus Altiarchaeota archaeon]|nr:30S ribosomal protein S27e [Candidatus Altiarchaeota archaeon]